MQNKLSFLLSPWSVMLGMLAGVIIGLYYSQLVVYLEPVGEVYLTVLMMCVIPILASAIITSIGKLVRSEGAGKYIKKIISVFIVFLVGVSIISVLTGVISQFAIEIDLETQRAIGEAAIGSGSENDAAVPGIAIKEIHSYHPQAKGEGEYGLVSFLVNIIPENIFSALVNDDNLQVIFFFTLFGIMLKYISEKASKTIITLFDGVFMAFQKLIKITMYFLPFGLAALIATQLSQVGFAVLLSLLQFIILLYVVVFLIFFFTTLVIWKYSSKPYLEQFRALGETLMICFGTRNSFAALPSSITALSDKLEFDQDKVNLSVPLGVSICRFGNVMVFSLGATFAAQLYGHPLGIEALIIIVITSVLAGMATSGAPGIIARTMISLVLTPLGIPAGAIIAMLLAVDPVIDQCLSKPGSSGSHCR